VVVNVVIEIEVFTLDLWVLYGVLLGVLDHFWGEFSRGMSPGDRTGGLTSQFLECHSLYFVFA